MRLVYFDNNATTPLDPRVLAAMMPWLTDLHGNPSSGHGAGRAARSAVEKARNQVAALLGAEPWDVLFTASGTEANNAVLAEVARIAGHGGRVVLSQLEHPSVRRAAERCGQGGMAVDVVPVDARGVVPPEAIAAALRPDTRLVCLMLANNEVGTLQPVREVAALCRERGVPLLCDAVQAAGKVPVDVHELGADFVVLGGHKFHGPLGAAALWVRPGAPFEAHLVGGSQEGRRRASTVNVPAVVGLGAACELAAREREARHAFLSRLRDRCEAGIGEIPDAVVHGTDAPRLPHTVHVAFLGLEGESLALRLDGCGYAVSTGSACSSGKADPSPALVAMGISAEEAVASLRISFGMTNTLDEVEAFLPVLAREVAALRSVVAA